MTPSGQTVCLCMIVKDEAPVIARCLASVLPLIDHWIIVDTGSTDGTQAIVLEAMKGMPGELVEQPWVDFGHNRSEALTLARPHADYSLVIDADDVFEVPAGFAMPPLNADSYVVDIKDASIAYQRSQLFRNALPWRYAGVLHEFPACEGAHSSGYLPVVMHRNHDGRRRRDPSTYRNDAAILERALEHEQDAFLVSRYTFYLAQSWRDCGEQEKALESYLRRADLGHWNEEIFVALLQAARIKEVLEHPIDDILATYARATVVAPTRAEALHGAAKLCRAKDRFEEGYWSAKRGVELSAPAAGLFVESWIYDFGLLDELGVHAYWSGRYADSRDACARLLKEGKLPGHMRERIEANLRFAVDRLGSARPSERNMQPDVVLLDPSDGDAFCLPARKSSPRHTQTYIKQSKIFRTIHIVWVGDEARRPDKFIDSWSQMNADWDVRIWGNHELRSIDWKNAAHIETMSTSEWCGVADMMRWEILETHGGFAVDADSICIRPLEDWLFESEIFACWENEHARPGLVANGYVYSRPGNMLVTQIINDIKKLPNVLEKLAWQMTGPQRLTDTIRVLNYADITIYPSHFFMPRHLTGIEYRGDGVVFAKQFWGRALQNVYQSNDATQV